jgi:hypothetical protein
VYYDLARCQWRLAAWWLIGLVLSVGLLILQVSQGTYDAKDGTPALNQTTNAREVANVKTIERAWNWLIPLVIPTFSVIVGGIVHAAGSEKPNLRVRREIYLLATWLSVVYLLLVFTTLAAVNSQNELGANVWLETSKLWLTPLGSPVGIVLGVFFASSHPMPTAGPPASQQPVLPPP